MKVTLQLSNGREMSFSEQELLAIVEKHLSSEDTKKATIAEVVKKPTEGEWFEVKPSTINQKLFEKKREDEWQEDTRKLILEAFEEMKNKTEKYGKNFKTMIPKKEWAKKTTKELKEMACNLGDRNADWVEQALEWAQRITNGESWESICNYADDINVYRLVIWKNGYARKVGGTVHSFKGSASYVYFSDFLDDSVLICTVPLVVIYDD